MKLTEIRKIDEALTDEELRATATAIRGCLNVGRKIDAGLTVSPAVILPTIVTEPVGIARIDLIDDNGARGDQVGDFPDLSELTGEKVHFRQGLKYGTFIVTYTNGDRVRLEFSLYGKDGRITLFVSSANMYAFPGAADMLPGNVDRGFTVNVSSDMFQDVQLTDYAAMQRVFLRVYEIAVKKRNDHILDQLGRHEIW